MAHMLDMSNRRANMAYTGEKPWHGLGQVMLPGEDIEKWRVAAGLGWEAVTSRAGFILPVDGTDTFSPVDGKRVIFRSDTKAPLSIVSDEYFIVQPKDVMQFYRDLCEKHGFTIETAGSLRGGRVIWALAKANLKNVRITGVDSVAAYLLLSTTFDGSASTVARFCAERVVCANTLGIALNEQGQPSISIPHSTKFDPDAVKLELGLGDAWYTFGEKAQETAERKMFEKETVGFLLKVYHDIDAPEDRRREKILINRLAGILKNAPGADMPSSKGTLWGVINAVTYDVDHMAKPRNPDSRLASAWFGAGDQRKRKAWDLATEYLKAA